MSVRGTLGGVFAASAVVIIGWQAGTAVVGSSATSTATGSASTGSGAADTGSSGTAGSSTSGSSSTGSSSTASGSGSGSGSTSLSALEDGTYTGTAEDTRFGTDQVQVTVSGGTITDVAAIQLSDREPRSEAISNRAAPVLREEVLSAQSAKVAYVSGATYTSDGYLASVQSALDQAER